MLRIALWLFCLIHALQGRRVQTVWAQEPSASFLPSSPGARIPMGSSSWTHPRPAVSKGQGQTRFGRRIQEISMSEEESDSIPLQIAQLSKKIAYLTVHTQKDRKDFYSLRGLSRMVQKKTQVAPILAEDRQARVSPSDFWAQNPHHEAPSAKTGGRPRYSAARKIRGKVAEADEPERGGSGGAAEAAAGAAAVEHGLVSGAIREEQIAC
mmetsp:Transcript_120433/g.220589  ORF Transcript_120433/g.220589 Transcript_120433/m.220589 type:complete len:210 (-) Transcript_120433:14-643(-)